MTPRNFLVLSVLGLMSACNTDSVTASTPPQTDPKSVDKYEPDNDASSAVSIMANDSAIQRNLSKDDQDWFKFTADSGVYYALTINANGIGNSSDTSAQGSVEIDDASIHRQATLGLVTGTQAFQCQKSGIYYIKVSYKGQIGAYSVGLTSASNISTFTTVQVAFPPTIESGSTISLIVETSNEGCQGVWCPDTRFVKFYADTGKTYTLVASGSVPAQVAYSNTSAQRDSAQFRTCSYGVSMLNCNYQHSGIQTISFQSPAVYIHEPIGRYTLSLKSGPAYWTFLPDQYEPDNNMFSAPVLLPDSSVMRHTFINESVDWMRIPMEAGKTYCFNFKALSSGSLPDGTGSMIPNIGNKIHGPIGAVRLFSMDSVLVATSYTLLGLMYTPKVSESFYLQVANPTSCGGYGAYGCEVGSYFVAVFPLPNKVNGPDSTSALAKSFQFDGVGHYNFIAGNSSWVKLQLDSGYSYSIKFKGLDDDQSSLYRQLFDSTLKNGIWGGVSGQSSDSVQAIVNDYICQKSQTMYLQIGPQTNQFPGYWFEHTSWGMKFMEYTLTGTKSPVYIAPPDNYESDDSLGLAKELSSNAPVQHRSMTSEGVDWVKLSIDSGYTYSIVVDSNTSSNFIGTTLFNLNGDQITTVTDSNPTVSFVGRRSTTYYAEIQGNWHDVTFQNQRIPFSYQLALVKQ